VHLVGFYYKSIRIMRPFIVYGIDQCYEVLRNYHIILPIAVKINFEVLLVMTLILNYS